MDVDGVGQGALVFHNVSKNYPKYPKMKTQFVAGWHYDISISIEIGHPSYILFHFCPSFERVP